MPQLNIHIDDDVFFKFREIETILKCRTHEVAMREIILRTYKQLKSNHSTS